MLGFIAALTLPTSAQYIPPASYQTVVQSPLNAAITISYLQPDAGTCTTAYATQKQYSGYINLPPYTLAPIQQNYNINTFFWFIEARQSPQTAPLTIWLSGGPGTSSMFGLFNEVGPCQVVQMEDGTYGTQVNEWGWDRSSNILFIDQPNEVGFSFDQPTNASLNLFSGDVFEPPTPRPKGLPSYMYLNGTFGTASSSESVPWNTTANTTEIAAQATWHFLQAWLSAFPQYNPGVPPNATSPRAAMNTPAGVNLFTESYGGKYAPVFASFFEAQNQARVNGPLSNSSSLPIQLQTVGILNGKIDDLIQDYYYSIFAYNNTYGIQAINEVEELNEINEYTNMCLMQIQECRAAMVATDPQGYGDVSTTNDLCSNAEITCNSILGTYVAAGYDPYDIRQKYPTPDPPAAYQEYLNYPSVLQAIGAQVNYTENSPYVLDGFVATGDSIRGGLTNDLASLLAMGVRVALVYGDADFLCNWYGGQAVSFAIADLVPSSPLPSSMPGNPSPPPSYAAGFASAGYADIVVNSTYVGGAARQYGNLSFSRIYESGHFVPYFQPETAFTLFTRIINGQDLSTGDPVDLSSFGSSGPANATFTTTASYSPAPTCWVRAWNQSCSDADTQAMFAGKGLVANGIFYLDNANPVSALPSTTVSAGEPGSPLRTIVSPDGPLTGVYTATGTPSHAAAVPGVRLATRLGESGALWPLVVVGVAVLVGGAVVVL